MVEPSYRPGSREDFDPSAPGRRNDGRPIHTEVGYLRPVPGSRVELLVVQPTGVAEIHAGRVEGRALEPEAVLVGVAPTAKPVTGVNRRIWVEGDVLHYRLRLGMKWRAARRPPGRDTATSRRCIRRAVAPAERPLA